MFGCLLKKLHVHQRLASHLLSENINRIRIFALIPIVCASLFLVRSIACMERLPWLTISFCGSMILMSIALHFFRDHIGINAQNAVLNATHLIILAISVSLYFCKGEFQSYVLTLYSIGILYCALTIVRQPMVMIAGYILSQLAVFGYSLFVYNTLPPYTHLFLLTLVTVIASTSAIVRFERSLIVFNEQEYIQRLNHQLEITSSTDKLTGLANRMKTDEELHRLMLRAKENCSPLSVILIDIDNFKQINDTYGHQTGDTVMQTIASVVRHNTRQDDFVGRWGGDEFLVICPQMELRQSVAMAERIKEAVSATSLPHGIKATISGGLGEISREENESGLFSRVDKALYNAKTRGRNRLEVSFSSFACA